MGTEGFVANGRLWHKRTCNLRRSKRVWKTASHTHIITCFLCDVYEGYSCRFESIGSGQRWSIVGDPLHVRTVTILVLCVRAYVSRHITKQMRTDVGPTPAVGPPKYLHDSHAHSSGRSVVSRVKGSRAGRAGASTEVPLWRTHSFDPRPRRV